MLDITKYNSSISLYGGSEVKKHLDLEIKLLLKRQENCTKTISLTLFVVTKFFCNTC